MPQGATAGTGAWGLAYQEAQLSSGTPPPEIINEVPWLRAPPHLLAGILHFSDGL